MYNISHYESALNNVVEKGSAEYDLIVESYNILVGQLPTTSSQAYSRLSSLDSIRPQLSALVFMIGSKLNRLNQEHSSKYYNVYTRWAVAGTKRSHAEIEAQIYRDDPNLLLLKHKIDDHWNVSEFVKSLLRSVDNAARSTAEAWRDNSRFS